MLPILCTNDPVLLSLAESLLEQTGIGCFVADRHISAIEGSIGAFPRRLMVATGLIARARGVLTDAGLGDELEPLA